MDEELLTLEELKGSMPLDTYINKRRYDSETEMVYTNSALIDQNFIDGEFIIIKFHLSVMKTEHGNLMPYISKILSGERYSFTDEPIFIPQSDLNKMSVNEYNYFKKTLAAKWKVETLNEQELLEIVNKLYAMLIISYCTDVPLDQKPKFLSNLYSPLIKYFNFGIKLSTKGNKTAVQEAGEKLLSLEELRDSIVYDKLGEEFKECEYDLDTEILIADSRLYDDYDYFVGGNFIIIKFHLLGREIEPDIFMPYISEIIGGVKYSLANDEKIWFYKSGFYYDNKGPHFHYEGFKKNLMETPQIDKEPLSEIELLKLINKYYQPIITAYSGFGRSMFENIWDLDSNYSVKCLHVGEQVYRQTNRSNYYNDGHDSDLKEYLGYERDYDGDIEFGDDYY